MEWFFLRREFFVCVSINRHRDITTTGNLTNWFITECCEHSIPTHWDKVIRSQTFFAFYMKHLSVVGVVVVGLYRVPCRAVLCRAADEYGEIGKRVNAYWNLIGHNKPFFIQIIMMAAHSHTHLPFQLDPLTHINWPSVRNSFRYAALWWWHTIRHRALHVQCESHLR